MNVNFIWIYLITFSISICTLSNLEAQILVDENFDNGSFAARGWYDNTNFPISSENYYEGSGALEIKYAHSQSIPTGGGAMRILFLESDSIYLRYFRKFDAAWVGTGYSYGPHEIYVLTNANHAWSGPAATHLTMYCEPNGASNGRKFRLAYQDIANENMPHGTVAGPVVGGYNGLHFTTGELFNDTLWHEIEVKLKLNSLNLQADSANHDGELKAWIDGILYIDEQNVVLRTPDFPQMKFNQLLIAPYFHDGVPNVQICWIDHLTISHLPIGINSGPTIIMPAKPTNLTIEN